ncbi:MAG: hypothetical protein KKD39_05655 [Candidatus Altiarchaeota archaeon]|nr:hypothetical protein [Candidatus Altiarchaeota archaeon]
MSVSSDGKPGVERARKRRKDMFDEKEHSLRVSELRLMQLPERRIASDKAVEKSERRAERANKDKPSMGSQELVSLIGEISLTQAIGRLKGRFGRGVSSESLVSEFQRGNQQVRQAIEDEIAKITGLRQTLTDGGRIRENPIVLQRKDTILHALRDAGYRKLTPVELSAVLAYRFGLSPFERQADGSIMMEDGAPVKSEFMQHMNAAERLSYGPDGVVSGTMANCLNVVRKGVLEDMHRQLWHPGTGSRIFSTDDLIRRLKIFERFGWDSENRSDQDKASNLITHAGGILESMGLVKKLPRRVGSDKCFRWIHTGYFESTYFPQNESVDYDLLMQLGSKGPTPLQDFVRPYVIGNASLGSPTGKYSPTTLRGAVNRMETEGLIEREKKGKAFILRLSDLGRSVVARQKMHDMVSDSTGVQPHLLEETRRALLASYAEGMSADEQRTLHNLVEEVMVIRRLADGRAVMDIVNEFSPPRSQDRGRYDHWYNLAYGISHGRLLHQKITTENMRTKYLPAIDDMEADRMVEDGTSQWLLENVIRTR